MPIFFECSDVQVTDLEDIGLRLPDSFKAALTPDLMKRFEYEFHSSSYIEMVEVITALRTVCGHLMKVGGAWVFFLGVVDVDV